jgi:hypothetical protein
MMLVGSSSSGHGSIYSVLYTDMQVVDSRNEQDTKTSAVVMVGDRGIRLETYLSSSICSVKKKKSCRSD